MSLLDGLTGVLAGIGDPASLVPQHHRATTIFALGDGALELTIVDRMVLDVHRKPVLVWIAARALGHRPALRHPIEFEPEVPVEPRRCMLLHDKAVARALELASLGLLRFSEVALAVVGLDVERG